MIMTGIALNSGTNILTRNEVACEINATEMEGLRTEDYGTYEKIWDQITDFFCGTHKADAKAALLTLFQADKAFTNNGGDSLGGEIGVSYGEFKAEDIEQAFNKLKTLAGAYENRFAAKIDQRSPTNVTYTIELCDPNSAPEDFEFNVKPKASFEFVASQQQYAQFQQAEEQGGMNLYVELV